LKITPLRPDRRVEAKQTFYTATSINVQQPFLTTLRAIYARRYGERPFGMIISLLVAKRGDITLKLTYITAKHSFSSVKIVHIMLKVGF
jgi:hypothetical protein